jgi:uncharacterized protein YndB with AHSA1/START domain
MTMQMQETEVRVQVTVAAPIERAFAVFTDGCDGWWPRPYRLGEAERTDARIEPRVGGRWYERTADGEQADWGEVLDCDAPERLVVSWQIKPDFRVEPDPARASRVEVRFAAEAPDRTTVTLVHRELERHGEQWETMRDAVAGAWPGIMGAYAAVAAT